MSRSARVSMSLVVVAAGALALFVQGGEANALMSGVCAPTVGSETPGPACGLDIWGYVTATSGLSLVGAQVTDGNSAVSTDSQGFYDLHEDVPGTYDVAVTAQGCPSQSGDHAIVNDPNVSTVSNAGGARQDFRLTCSG